MNSLFYHILYLLVTEYRLMEVEESCIRKNRNLNRLAVITSYMKEHYASDLTLEEVARVFGYSPTYLSRMFQKYAGITYKNYLQNIRLEYAMKDLKGGFLSVTEAALRSGFSGSKALARAFQKKYGMLPSTYREICKAGSDGQLPLAISERPYLKYSSTSVCRWKRSDTISLKA